MNRRNFVSAAASAGVAAVPASAAAGNAIFEMRWFRMRNGSQVQRTTEFLGKHFVPAAKRLGIGPMGFFNSVIGEQGPFVLALASYPSFQAAGDAADRMMSDKEFQKGFDEYNSLSELSYIRMENSLLRAFDGWPRHDAAPRARNAAHLRDPHLRIQQRRGGQAQDQDVQRRRGGHFQAPGLRAGLLRRDAGGPQPSQPGLHGVLRRPGRPREEVEDVSAATPNGRRCAPCPSTPTPRSSPTSATRSCARCRSPRSSSTLAGMHRRDFLHTALAAGAAPAPGAPPQSPPQAGHPAQLRPTKSSR